MRFLHLKQALAIGAELHSRSLKFPASETHITDSSDTPSVNDRNLLLRMSVVSTFIFGFYLALAYVALQLGVGLPVVAAALVVFVGIQYVVGTRAALWQVGAVPLPDEEFDGFLDVYEDAATAMGFDEPPDLLVTRMGVPNAFAVGRKGNGTVVVSAELLYLLDFDEAQAVLAHELAHLDNRDSVLMVVGESVSTIVGLVTFTVLAASDSAVVSVLAYVVGAVAKLFVMLFVLALSRYREYAADRDAAAAMDTGDPLARALTKIDGATDPSAAQAPSSVSALCINGFDDGVLASLLSTHPPTEKRVERLREL
jgi:heat shock protein HtpX